MDVGKAVGQFEIKGLTESVNQLKHFQDALKTIAFDYKTHRKQQMMVVEAFKQQSPAIAAAIGKEKFFAGALRRTSDALKRQQTELQTATKLIKTHQDALKMSTKPMVDLSAVDKSAQLYARVAAAASRARTNIIGLASGAKRLAASFVKIAAASTVRTLRDFYIWGKKGVSIVYRLITGAGKLYTRLRRLFGLSSHKGGAGWWARFGAVAAGFSVAYHAINAIDAAARKLTATFAAGLTTLDNYRQSLATISSMLALLSTGGGGFTKRFEFFHRTMQQTMRESMRLAPMFRLSMDEISEAYKELAQFGVRVTPDITKNSLTAIAAIKEIAVTTGSSTRQIRQEIQAVFSGQTRVTDQFGRFLKRFPEIRKALFGINKMATTNQEKWSLALETISNYFHGIIEANKTVSSQAQIMQNTLSIISMRALEASGIYNHWVSLFTRFNDRLIDAKGNLGDLGKRFYQGFSAIWQVLNKLGVITVIVSKHVAEVVKGWYEWTKGLNAFRIHALKGYVAVMMLSTGIKTVLAVARFTFGHLTGALTISIAAIAIARRLLINLTDIDYKPLLHPFENWHLSLTGISEKLYGIYNFFSKLKEGAKPTTLLRNLRYLNDINVLREYGLDFQNATQEQMDAWLATFGEKERAIIKKTLDEAIELRDSIKGSEALRKMLLPAPVDIKGGIERAGDEIKKATTEAAEDMHHLFENFFSKVTGLKPGDLKLDIKLIDPEKFKQVMNEIDQNMQNFGIKFNNMSEELKKTSKAAFEYIGEFFGDYVGDVMRGEFDSISDAASKFLKGLRDMFADAMRDIVKDYIKSGMLSIFGNKTFGNLIGAIGSGISGLFSGPSSSAIMTQSSIAYAGTTGATAPSAAYSGLTTGFASGGIIPEPVFGIGASGRHYTFAENGPERILSNSDSFGSVINMQVNVINQTSRDVRAEQGQGRFDGRKFVTDVILKDRTENGPITNAFRSLR